MLSDVPPGFFTSLLGGRKKRWNPFQLRFTNQQGAIPVGEFNQKYSSRYD